MPAMNRPPRICSYPSCPFTADECTNTAHQAGGWTPDHVRGNRHQRGYGTTWERRRRSILRRDPICTICHNAPSTEVDHRVPKSDGGGDEASNLRGVCSPCHRDKTLDEAAAARTHHHHDNDNDDNDEGEGGGGGPRPGPSGTYGGCVSGSVRVSGSENHSQSGEED